MAGIDEQLHFTPVKIAILTVSDTRTMETDTSGQTLADRVTGAGHSLADRKIVPDHRGVIETVLREWIMDDGVDVIISTGGTGLTGRDVTVEAHHAVYDKEISGFSVLFHTVSHRQIGLSTMQSRATAGLAKGTVLFALPGSTGAVKDGWDEIIRFQLDSRYRPCNLVEIMPRFLEAEDAAPADAIDATDAARK